ncbi:MAG: GGDEF domain-containing protein [Janthinobacterium lividum]
MEQDVVASVDALVQLYAALADLEDLVRSDPDRAALRALDLQDRAAELGDTPAVANAIIAHAEAVQRGGDSAMAAVLIKQAKDVGGQLSSELRVRASLILARVFTDLGDRSTALEHALDAVAAFDEGVPRRLRTRILLVVADLLDDLGDRDDSRIWYSRAEELALGDGQMHMMVANNRAYCELAEGDVESAGRELHMLQELSKRYQRPLDASALDTMARIHLLRGAPGQAVEVARSAVRTVEEMDSRNAGDLPGCLLTLAVALRADGEPESARQTLQQARDACGLQGCEAVRTDILQEEAEVFAALGDFESAFSTHKAFYAADQEMLSIRREAQVRARQAMVETDMAREEAAHYREQARRDPLTGLGNRLFVDERMPAVLAEGVSAGECVSAVLLDLDHFKSVNDTFSHAAGDRVLQILASILQTAVADLSAVGSFAARLGGEEFLLLLITPDAAGAVVVAEYVRAALEGHDWSDTTPGRTITSSAGVAIASGDSTKTSLLSRADVQLYAAKAAGRNRVCVDPVFTTPGR